MKTSIIRSTWLAKGGYRLDCSPYLGGALEAQVLLEELTARKDPLGAVTVDIFNGPQFVRNYLDNPDLGVPFMTGSSMKLADLSRLPLLSKKDAHSKKLRHLAIKPGMTLISCSGTIGQMAYARPEMVGIWASQDVLKVVPDTAKILSGYLYAFLSSKYGIPLITSGTYGGIIQHLEPEHISGLPVPRFGTALEKKIHNLVEEAAVLRTNATDFFLKKLEELERKAGLIKTCVLRRLDHQVSGVVLSSKLGSRFDTNFHSPLHYRVIDQFDKTRVKSIRVGAIAASIVEPPRFKRIKHDDPVHSVPLFGTGGIGDVDPQPISWITEFPGHQAYVVGRKAVLIPRSGQLNGIIGTATLPIGAVRTGVVSEHAIRINCHDEMDAGYLYLALSSQTGLIQLKARAFGGSIPTLDVANVASVLIPALSPKERKHLGSEAYRVATMRTEALEKESKARELLVQAIESNAS